AWSVEAGHQAELDRIASHAEYNRNRARRRLSRECGGGRGWRGNHAYPTANEIGRQLWQPIESAFCPAIFDRHVLAFEVTGLSKALLDRGHKVAPLGGGGGVKEPDHRHRRRLRARRDRPRGRRAAEQRDELAAPHIEHRGVLQPPRIAISQTAI